MTYRKIALFVIAQFLLFLMLSSCSFLPNGDVDPKGRWIEVETKATLKVAFIPISENWTYNPQIDQYYDAVLIDISDSLFTLYVNSSGNDYYSAPVDIILSRDSISFYSVEHEDSLEQADSVSLKMRINWKDQLIISISEKTDNIELIFETIYDRYNAEFPPSSWNTDITDDLFEPDSSIQTATPLVLNETQSHSLTAEDSDYYSFNADSGKTYLMKVLAYRGIEQWLLDSEGSTILMHDVDNDDEIDKNNNNIESAILWDCESTGDYYIKVAMENSTQYCYYQYNLKESSSTLAKSLETTSTLLTRTSVSKKILERFFNSKYLTQMNRLE